MTLTAQQALGHITHAVDGLSAPLTGLSLLNEAGEFLVSMRDWEWLASPPVSLDTVASQSYVDLPSDCAAILTLEANNGLHGAVQLTTFSRLQAMRTDASVAPSWYRYAAVVWAQATSGVPAPRLELWPTPSTSTVGEITLLYRKGWTTLTDDEDAVRIPAWIESLYIAIVRAFAKGYEEDVNVPIEQLLAQIQLGPQFLAAKRRDSSMQVDYGPIEGGAASWCETSVSSDWPWIGPTP